jgi:MFS family permease
MRHRSIALLLGSAYLARIPVTAIPLALILLAREGGRSYAFAGIATGAYTVSLALTAPVLGRLADRFGTRPVLAIGGPLCAAALLVLAAGGVTMPGAAFVALAIVAGAVLPPLGPLARSLFPRMLQSPAVERLYAIDASAQELAFVIGPLVIAGLVAVMSPAQALAVVAAMLTVGVLIFSVISSRVPGPRPAGDHLHRTPLASAGLRAVLAVTFLLGVGYGTIEISIPAAMDALGERGRAGLVLAVWSLGSMIGGAIAAVRVTDDQVRRLQLVLAGSVVIGGVLPLVADRPDALIPLLVVHGAMVAPALAVLYALVPANVPGRLTEAFAWLSSALVGGIAAGTALAGAAVDAFGVPAGFALGALAALASLTVATLAARGVWSAGRYSAASASSARIL